VLDRPIAVAMVVLAASVVFVLARLIFGTSFDITRFIVVGSFHVVGHGLPSGIHVFPGTGYDGQFYYRQALGPFNTATVAHGIRLDGDYRLQRLGYPVLAWIVGLAQVSAAPYTLVVVNVAGMFLLGLLGAIIARESGRHCLYGLLIAGYFGLVTTLARDLTEIVEVGLLLAGVLAFRRSRYLLAALAFAGAVITKETEVFVVAGYVVAIFWALGRSLGGRGALRGGRPPLAAHLVWLLPAVAFSGVQLWLYEATGSLAGKSGAQGNFATPLTAPWHALSRYLHHPFHLANAIWLAELALLVLVVAVALLSLHRTSALLHERVAFVFLVGLALSLSGEVWYGQADFRSLAPLFEMGAVVALGSRRRLGLLAAVIGVAFFVTYVHRVRFT
jgi:fluoride ion exporter CrcB/FEX